MDARQLARRSKFVFYQNGRIILSILTTLLGIVVLIGWYSRTPSLIQVLPSFVPMQYNTALGFLLSGLGLLLVRYPRIATIFSVLVGLIGLLTLFEYITGFDLGIDQFFMHHYIIVKTSHPGRMAPNTALCFTLTGITLLTGLVIKQFSTQKLFSLLLSILIIILGFIALFGYFTSVSTTYGWGHLTHMAVHTSLGFIFIGFGLLFYNLDRLNLKGKISSLGFPFVIMVVCIAITISIWQIMLNSESIGLNKSVRHAKNQASVTIIKSLKIDIMELNQLVNHWELRGKKVTKDRLINASRYFKAQDHEDIAWIDKNGKLSWIYQLQKKQYAHMSDADLKINTKNLDTETGQVITAHPRKMGADSYVIVIHRSVFYNKIYQGSIFSFLHTKLWLNSLFPDFIKRNWVIRLKYKNNVFYKLGKNTDPAIREKWKQITTFNLGNFPVTLEIWPTRYAYQDFYSWSPTFIFIAGLLISVMLALLRFMWGVVKKSKNQAENANKAKSKFLSSMSHELRTPLNAAIGYAQLLECDESLPKEKREFATLIHTSTKHLLELINDVLDLAMIESGKVELSIESVSLNDIMEKCLNFSNPIAEKYQVKLQYDMHAHKDVYLKGDYMRLKQIILNVLTNAIKYNKLDGSVTVLVDSIFDNKVRISIKDTGKGISQELQQKLFQPFQRLGEERGDIEGTGIGLLIMKNMTEMLEGTVAIDSQEGIGTTVFLTFPCGRLEEYKRKSIVKEMDKNFLSTESIKLTQKILLVEDNPLNQAIVSQQLLFFKCEVDIASDGQAGYDCWKKGNYSLILMDCNMPIMDGLQLTRLIRQEELKSNKHIPIIAFTANAYKENLKKCYDAGMDDYLIKPVELGLLKEKLLRWASAIAKSDHQQDKIKDDAQDLDMKTTKEDLINLAILEKYVGKDKDIQRIMLLKFIEMADEIAKNLKAAYKDMVFTDIQFNAHKLKSSAKAVGSIKLADVCLNLEDAAKNNNQHAITELIPRLLNLLEDVKGVLKNKPFLILK